MEAINGANDVEFSFPYEWHGQYLNQSSRAFFVPSSSPVRVVPRRYWIAV
jgi:hypothetical protein